MNKKSKEALKNAFNIPEPDRKEQFLDSLDVKTRKKLPAHIPMYISAVATAVLVIGVWGNIKNLPEIDQPELIDKPVYSQTLTENYTENIIQTTTASSTKATSKNTSSQTTTITGTVTITVTTAKENKKPPEISSEIHETQTCENTTAEETTEIKESYVKETTARFTTTSTTAGRTTVTTTTRRTTATTQRTTVTTTTSESELDATTTTTKNDEPPLIQTVPKPNVEETTTTVTTEDNVSEYDPPDYTVEPPVRYYPADDAIRIEENNPEDGITPPSGAGTPPISMQYDLKSLAESSDLIVIATADEVIYTGLDGVPYTQENINIENVLYGDISNFSRISVYSVGGYIPADEFSEMQISWAVQQNRTLYVPYDNKTTPEVGNTCVYFLKKSDDKFPDGSYILTSLNDISKFRYKDSRYTNLNYEDITFNLSELYEYLNN